jgi:hypothetical protein
MIYKGFAAGVLIATPLIILAIQDFLPETPPADSIAAAPAAVAASPVVSPPTPVPPPSAPALPPISIGQPLPGVGQPAVTASGTPPMGTPPMALPPSASVLPPVAHQPIMGR